MSIHAAIKEVSKHYTMPIKTGCYSWQFTLPHDINKPHGATRTIQTSGSYNKALADRRACIAADAVMLLVGDCGKAYSAMHDVSEQGYSIAEAVKRNIA